MRNPEAEFISSLFSASRQAQEKCVRTLDESWFRSYPKEVGYIRSFLVKYQKMPDRETFGREFPAFNNEPVVEPPDFYLRQIKDKFVFGIAKRSLTSLVQELREDKLDGFGIVTRIHELADRLQVSENSDSILWGTATEKARRYAQRKKSEGLFYDLPFGSLRRAVGRRPPENMMTFFARPGVGKTWWACLCAVLGACSQGLSTGLVSFEMSREEMEDRCDGIRLKLPWGAFNSGRMSLKEEIAYQAGLKRLAKENPPLYIQNVNSPTFGVPDLESWVIDNGISLLVVDAAHEIYSSQTRDKVEKGYWLANELKMLCQRRKLFGIFTVQEGRAKKGVSADELASWSDAWLQKSDLFARITGDKQRVERRLETLKVRNGAYCSLSFKLCLEPVNIHEVLNEEDYIEIGPEG